MVKISAIIPTYNRSDLLPAAIESLLKQSLPISQFEIVVVDNASTDQTRTICESFRDNGNFRYVFEGRQGLNTSRMTGVENSTGDHIAFIDDDAIASHEWLERILWAFENVSPSPGAVGGKIHPIWEAPKPDWFPDYKGPYLTILDYGNEGHFIEYPRILFGTNMAFKKELILRHDLFGRDLDRQKRKLIGGGDSWAFSVFAKQRIPVYYLPEASVDHLVPKERATKQWLYRRHYWQGRTEVVLVKGGGTFDRLRELQGAFVKVSEHVRKIVEARRPDEKFAHTAILAQQWGRIVQSILP